MTQTFGSGYPRVAFLPGGAFTKPSGPADQRFCQALASAGMQVFLFDYPLNTPIEATIAATESFLEAENIQNVVGVSAGAILGSLIRKRLAALTMASGCATYRWLTGLTGRTERLAAQFFLGDPRSKMNSPEARTLLRKVLPEFRSFHPATQLIAGRLDQRIPSWVSNEYAGDLGIVPVWTNLDHGIEQAFEKITLIQSFQKAHG